MVRAVVRAVFLAALGAELALLLASAAAPAHAAFPGHNGLIAFNRMTAHGWTVAAVRSDRTGLRTLVENGEGPVWSPQGQSLAFNRRVAGRWEIFVANADGSGQRDVHTGSSESWSPDGQSLAFTYLAGGGWEIAVVNADGTGARDVHPGYSPSWSPDGTQLLFTDGWNLFLINASGGDPQQLTSNDSGQGSGIGKSEWSPDGRWIAFDDSGAISAIHPDGSDPIDISGDETSANFEWSPDGTRITYDLAGTGGWQDIWVAGNDPGSKSYAVTRTLSDEGAETWSPDGTMLVYTRFRIKAGANTGYGDIYVVGAQGTGRRPLARGNAPKGYPAWQPTT